MERREEEEDAGKSSQSMLRRLSCQRQSASPSNECTSQINLNSLDDNVVDAVADKEDHAEVGAEADGAVGTGHEMVFVAANGAVVDIEVASGLWSVSGTVRGTQSALPEVVYTVARSKPE